MFHDWERLHQMTSQEIETAARVDAPCPTEQIEQCTFGTVVLASLHRTHLPMPAVAWDIETCPFPLDNLSRSQQARYDNELAHKLSRKPEMDHDAASRLVRSVHPFLGWICCISAVSGTLEASLDDSRRNDPISWTARSPGEEADLLDAFWEAVAGFPQGTLWITFNGKRFDVPFVEARSAARGISPTRSDLRDTYPYSMRPHADLAHLWPQHYSLDGLCALLGVPSPKEPSGEEWPGQGWPGEEWSREGQLSHGGQARTGLVASNPESPAGLAAVSDPDAGDAPSSEPRAVDGSAVAQWVAGGQMGALKAYAKRDAIATWTCAQRALPQLRLS
jgi:hypothetical protein